MSNPQDTQNLLAELTDKQREVLDLLVRHKTSKQIARDLGISPHTVDQRIVAARRKFSVETRNELAAEYMAAQAHAGEEGVYGKPVYQSSHVDHSTRHGDQGFGSDTVSAGGNVHADNGISPESAKPLVQYRVVPESFEGRYGYFWRFAALIGITLGLLIATLVGLAIFGELSELLR